MIRYVPDGMPIANGISYTFNRWDWRIIVQIFNDYRFYLRHRNKAHPGNYPLRKRWIIEFEKRK